MLRCAAHIIVMEIENNKQTTILQYLNSWIKLLFVISRHQHSTHRAETGPAQQTMQTVSRRNICSLMKKRMAIVNGGAE